MTYYYYMRGPRAAGASVFGTGIDNIPDEGFLPQQPDDDADGVQTENVKKEENEEDNNGDDTQSELATQSNMSRADILEQLQQQLASISTMIGKILP